jgi:biopolymer transport protein ExbD
MRPVRRHDLSPRVEIMPLIDVIFLLLTFFIYSLVTMVRAEILPVQLQTLTTGQAAEPATIVAVTIDARGGLYLNRVPIDEERLDQRLGEIAQLQEKPKLFLALEDTAPQEVEPGPGESPGVVDRGPLLIGLIERVRRAGISDFNIVGDSDSP